MRQRGFLRNHFFSLADAYVGITPQFKELYRVSGLPENRLKQIPNGVDTNWFRPVTAEQKAKLRVELGLPEKMKLIIFVGHFSREKCPDILLNAWLKTVSKNYPHTGLIFIGSTNTNNYEVDARLVEDIQELVDSHVNERVFFIERTHEIEKYYQAVDIFVLASLREGMPNALLEAMSSGLPVIVSRLEGITDWVVEDGVSGLLFTSDSEEELGEAMIRLMQDSSLAFRLSKAARQTIENRFSLQEVSLHYEKLYVDLSQ